MQLHLRTLRFPFTRPGSGLGFFATRLTSLTSLAVAAFLPLLSACKKQPSASAGEAEATGPQAPAGSLKLVFSYGSEKQAWLEEATKLFNAGHTRTPGGKPIFVETLPMGSGDCVSEVLQGQRQAHLLSPASTAFFKLAATAPSTTGSGPLVEVIAPSLVLSPIVIAMWEPMARKLGWPETPLGWADIHALATHGQGWASVGAPHWGKFRFGHTHPEYSNSGLLAVLAEVAAGTQKVRGLTVADVQAPKTADYVREIERAVVHYGESTGFFAEKMFANGPGYLSAAVLYENMVVQARSAGQPGSSSTAGSSHTAPTAPSVPVVAIYPKEGTYWSDHPVGLVQRPWVTAEHAEAARQYVAYLMTTEPQQKALHYGFRPGDPAVTLGAPVDAAHGVDPAQPQTLLEMPDVAVIEAVQKMWSQNKKRACLALVLDTSGSMKQEDRIGHARQAAQGFISKLGDQDLLSILTFSHQQHWLCQGQRVGEKRAQLLQMVGGLFPEGGTSLYDAVQEATTYLQANATPDTIPAVIVLSDGADESSKLKYHDLMGRLKQATSVESGGGVRIFTIAYGKSARMDVLQAISELTKGKAYQGDTKDINKVFRDIAVFF